jgi:hypothetical protein
VARWCDWHTYINQSVSPVLYSILEDLVLVCVQRGYLLSRDCIGRSTFSQMRITMFDSSNQPRYSTSGGLVKFRSCANVTRPVWRVRRACPLSLTRCFCLCRPSFSPCFHTLARHTFVRSLLYIISAVSARLTLVDCSTSHIFTAHLCYSC